MASDHLHAALMDACIQRLLASTELFIVLEKNSTSSSCIQTLRFEIIEFILEMSSYVPEAKIAKDTAIQMFDTYLLQILHKNADLPLSKCCELKMVAFGCYVLSIKLHSSYKGILEDFKRKASEVASIRVCARQCSEVEALIMNEIAFAVSPLASPVYAYRLIFRAFFDQELRLACQEQRKEFCQRIERTIDECHKSAHFLQYCASTVAIACFVYCCASLPFDCDLYIGSAIPDVFFSDERVGPSSVDVSACVDAILLRAPASRSPHRKGAPFTPKDVASLSRDISDRELAQTHSSERKKRRSRLPCEYSLDTMLDTILKSVAVCESASLDEAHSLDWIT